jgi:hypothetical protein
LCLPFLKRGSSLGLTCFLKDKEWWVPQWNGYTQSCPVVSECAPWYLFKLTGLWYWEKQTFRNGFIEIILVRRRNWQKIVWTQSVAQIFCVLDISSTQLCNHKTVPYQCDLNKTECILNIVKTKGAHSAVEVQNIIMQDIGNAWETGKI